MNPIRKLYQKLLGSSDKKSVLDESNKPEDEQDVVTNLLAINPDEDCPCYIYFEIDRDGTVQMSSYWDGSEMSIPSFTELLFNLCTGKMTGNIFEFLERECEQEQYEIFLQIVAGYTHLLQLGLSDFSEDELEQKDDLVVRPSDISKKNMNPFEVN